MKERRRYARLNIPLDVHYLVRGQKQKLKSVTKNISPNGVRFALEKEVPAGEILDIEIKIPNKPEPIPIKARLVWSKKELKQGKDVFDAGFEFVQVPDESKNEFFQYLCNLMYEQLKKI